MSSSIRARSSSDKAWNSFGPERLAVAHRREREAGRGLQEDDVLLLGQLADLAHGPFLALLQLLFERLGAGAVLVALEDTLDRAVQILDQLVHVALELRPLPGGRRSARGRWASSKLKT
jgi:hypothetical protein